MPGTVLGLHKWVTHSLFLPKLAVTVGCTCVLRKVQCSVMKHCNQGLSKAQWQSILPCEEVGILEWGGRAWQKVNLAQSPGSGDEGPCLLRSLDFIAGLHFSACPL